MTSGAPNVVTLSLISHTNAGKTTLARTLLGRDVGEVRDAGHVTVEATRYVMIETAEGDVLALWDTPGFGDSARLARRLAQQSHPIGWFLAQVWDRFRDRPLWLAQHAVRNVRDQADVVLYLVNASEAPGDAGYVEPELDVLAWIGKPVIALLNQTGPPRPPETEAAEAMRWRETFAQRPFTRAVLPLDAFARCWVQEITLLHHVIGALGESKRAAAERLAAAWQARRVEQFDAAMAALARPIATAACDAAKVDGAPAGGALRQLGRAMGLERDDSQAEALQMLARRLEEALRVGTDELIRIYELEGRATIEVLARLAGDVVAREPLHEGKAAVLGGVVSGALSGLAADLALGGLTFGAGLITGGLLGALGGAGFARGYNVVRGHTETRLQWSEKFLDELVQGALLRYLAIAHYGRGRGGWAEAEYPAFWHELAKRAVEQHRPRLHAAWSERADDATARLAASLAATLRDATLGILHELYPGVDLRPSL